MATEKQKKVARELVENLKRDKPIGTGEILEKSGYGQGTKKTPKDIIDSTGVKEELKNLGFTVEGADGVVREILYGKKTQSRDKLKAAEMIYKRLGANAPEKGEFKLNMIPIMGGLSVRNKEDGKDNV